MLEEHVNPYGMDSDGSPVMGIIGIRSQRTRTGYPMSPTNYAVDLNREKNKRRAQFIANISHNVNAPIQEPMGKTKWIGEPGTPGSRVQVANDAAFPVSRLQSGGLDAVRFLEAEQLSDEDIDDQYDLHDVMRGKIPAGQDNIAGRTVLALQDLGGMMTKPFLRSLEAAMIRLARVNMAIILKYWPRRMWERLIEPDELGTFIPTDGPQPEEGQEPKQAEIQAKWLEALNRIKPKNQEDAENATRALTMMDIDIRLSAGSSMPTNRMAKMQISIELAGAGIYDAEAALTYIDDPEKDKIIKRLEARQQAELQAGVLNKGR